MHTNIRVSKQKSRLTTLLCTSILAGSALAFGTDAIGASNNNKTDSDQADSIKTASPIKHVIILIGENRGLDHTFGVYTPKGKKQTISNILSKGIVNIDGTPGPNFGLAQQFSVAAQSSWYFGAPDTSKIPYSPTNLMPQPNTNGAPSAPSRTGAPFTSVAVVQATGETDLSSNDFELLTTGATGLPAGVLDTRIPGAGTLPPGPFPLQGPNITDDDYTGDMTHRFFQAAQQQDCSLANATFGRKPGLTLFTM